MKFANLRQTRVEQLVLVALAALLALVGERLLTTVLHLRLELLLLLGGHLARRHPEVLGLLVGLVQPRVEDVHHVDLALDRLHDLRLGVEQHDLVQDVALLLLVH